MINTSEITPCYHGIHQSFKLEQPVVEYNLPAGGSAGSDLLA